jgi:transcriptional regulator with XRE-family HTH domain
VLEDFSDDTCALNVWRMSVKKLLRLPGALVAARQARALLQKQAAASVGLCQTVLSAIETGRRTPESSALLVGLANVYELSEEQTSELLLAGAHDHLMLSLRGSLLEPAAELISEAALLHRRLSEDEVAGLLADLRELKKSKERIRSLVLRGLPTSTQSQGRPAM